MHGWDLGIKYFSGTASYSNAFELEDVPKKIVTDLGDVQNIAEVIVNRQSVRKLWKTPYRVDVKDYVYPISGPAGLSEMRNFWSRIA